MNRVIVLDSCGRYLISGSHIHLDFEQDNATLALRTSYTQAHISKIRKATGTGDGQKKRMGLERTKVLCRKGGGVMAYFYNGKEYKREPWWLKAKRYIGDYRWCLADYLSKWACRLRGHKWYELPNTYPGIYGNHAADLIEEIRIAALMLTDLNDSGQKQHFDSIDKDLAKLSQICRENWGHIK